MLQSPDRLSSRHMAAGVALMVSLAALGQTLADSPPESRLESGKRLTMARDKGNCLV